MYRPQGDAVRLVKLTVGTGSLRLGGILPYGGYVTLADSEGDQIAGHGIDDNRRYAVLIPGMRQSAD